MSQNVRYVNDVPRIPDSSRRERLLSEILDHLGDSSLASFSFRTLARSLGVSTYSLVYYFGTREELLSEIVRAIAERQKSAEPRTEEIVSIDDHLEQIRASFEWQLDPKNLKVQRLEFEAATMATPDSQALTSTVFGYWMTETERILVNLGLSTADAAIEARILNNLFYGFQYDLVVNGDFEAASTAFAVVLERHREHLCTVIARSV